MAHSAKSNNDPKSDAVRLMNPWLPMPFLRNPIDLWDSDRYSMDQIEVETAAYRRGYAILINGRKRIAHTGCLIVDNYLADSNAGYSGEPMNER